eukprot:387473-Prorocentrum_minimum.AAC.1
MPDSGLGFPHFGLLRPGLNGLARRSPNERRRRLFRRPLSARGEERPSPPPRLLSPPAHVAAA